MPIQTNSKLLSSVVNAVFLDKTIDDTMNGQLTLNDGNTPQIDNIQEEANIKKRYVSKSLYNSNDQISINAISDNQILKVEGNAAPVVLNALAFDSQPLDGVRLMLVGQSDTNTVKINLNDSQYGQYINGDATLKRGYIIELIYDADLERFLEIRRNF